MITSCLRTGDSLRLDLPEDDIRAALADGDGLLWVDIAASPREESEALLRDVFGFHHLTIDDCYNTLIDPPKVDDYGTYLFVIIHDVTYGPASRGLHTVELDMYVGPNYVVTLHREPVAAIGEVRRRAENHSLVLDRGAGFLAHAVFDVVVDDFHPVVETLDEQLSAVEEEILHTPRQDVLEDLLRLKRNAQRLKRSILPQRDVANRFSRGEYSRLVPADSLMYFRDIYDHTVRVDEMIDGVRDLADSALNTYLSSVNNRINEVMKALAIVAVVFLPLTLIASIYGTNFEETWPPYAWDWGFRGMLATFALVVLGLVAWFRWRRWV